MTIEDRLKYIKSEYGEDAEKMWRQIAQLPNFKEEFLTDDKLFMCITQRGFMSQNGNLGLKYKPKGLMADHINDQLSNEQINLIEYNVECFKKAVN